MGNKRKQKTQAEVKSSSTNSTKKLSTAHRKIEPIKKYSRNELLQILIFAISILVAGYLLYHPVVDYDLVYCDDNIFLQDLYKVNTSPDNYSEVFNKTMGTSYYRPILNLSIIYDTQVSLEKQYPGVDPRTIDPRSITPEVFHNTNLILHLLASLLVFVFLVKLRYPIIASFFFGLIVTVHPILTPAVAWISGRNDTLITIFMLLSFISMVFYFERKGIFQVLAFIFHIFFFGVALFTKEITAFFPFVVFAYLLLFNKREKLFDSKYLILLVGQFIMGLIWFAKRAEVIAKINNPDTVGIDALPDTYLTIPALIGKFFLPVKMIALSSFELFSIATGIIAIIGIIVYMIYSKKIDKNKAYFGFIWFILLLFPTLLIRIIFVGDFFDYAEHRAYLVIVGLIIFILELLRVYKIDYKKPIPIAVFTVIILLITYKSYGYKDEFENRKTFWSHMTEMYPYKSRGYLDLGKAYLVEDSLDKAEELYHLGIERNPDNKNLYIDLAAVYLRKNDLTKAESYAKTALKIEPNNNIAHYNLAKALFAQSKFKESLVHYEYACRSPKSYDWFKELGDNYYRVGRPKDAILSYQKVLSGNPNNAHALTNMGLSYSVLNNYPEAEKAWLRSVQINPKIPEAYYNLIRLNLYVKKDIQTAQRFISELERNGGKLPADIQNALSKGVK